MSQQGYLAIGDFDFRKPAQITAGVREVEAPYRDWSNQEIEIEEAETKAIEAKSWWQNILSMLTSLECRITLFQIRWNSHNQNEK